MGNFVLDRNPAFVIAYLWGPSSVPAGQQHLVTVGRARSVASTWPVRVTGSVAHPIPHYFGGLFLFPEHLSQGIHWQEQAVCLKRKGNESVAPVKLRSFLVDRVNDDRPRGNLRAVLKRPF